MDDQSDPSSTRTVSVLTSIRLTVHKPLRRIGEFMGLALTILGCANTTALAHAPAGPFTQTDSVAVIATIQAAWAAGAARDTTRVNVLTLGVQPRRWLLARGSNGYFENSSLDMKIASMSRSREDAATAELHVVSSFVSCPKPFHSGAPDVYTIRLRRHEGLWRIEEIGMPIC